MWHFNSCVGQLNRGVITQPQSRILGLELMRLNTLHLCELSEQAHKRQD